MATYEGLDAGRDLRLPVTPAYVAPFELEGDFNELVFDLR